MSRSEVKLFLSKNTVLPDCTKPAIIEVSNGKIRKILPFIDINEMYSTFRNEYSEYDYEDFGDLVLMSGIVDSHVHVDEPGRTEWEGFWSATKAAAAGGVTTIVDMPLNSIPPTTTVENLKTKTDAARSKAFVDIGFWGGVVPGNQKDLKPLVECGVTGFKCFLCPSGIEEFGHVNKDDVEKAMKELQNLNTVLSFHAECEDPNIPSQPKDDPSNYDTYLQTRPESMEIKAIEMILELCKIYNCRCHIVHLSAGEALNLIKTAKERRLPLTVETCYHYLCLSAEKVPRFATEFKCCPPIRNEINRIMQAIPDKNSIELEKIHNSL